MAQECPNTASNEMFYVSTELSERTTLRSTGRPSPRVSMRTLQIRMEVASWRPDHLPTLSAAKTSKLSLIVRHHILAIDEASQQQQQSEDVTSIVLETLPFAKLAVLS